MIRHRVGRLLIALAIASAQAGCQYFPSPPPGWEGDFTVENVLARADQALVEVDPTDGADPDEEPSIDPNPERLPPRFLDAADMVATVRMARPGGDARDMLVKWRRGGDWSLSMRDGGGEVRYVGAGAAAVELKNGAVTRRDVPLDEIGIRHFLRSLFVISFFQTGPGTEPEIIEPVELPDGRHVVNVRKYDERGLGWVLSLDSETVRPARLREWVLVGEDEGAPRDTYFREFAKDAQGRLYPQLMQTYDRTTLVQETVVRELAVNQGLSKADFRVPSP